MEKENEKKTKEKQQKEHIYAVNMWDFWGIYFSV
jgi:hypothetical protein